MNYIRWIGTFKEDSIEFVDEGSVVNESWLGWDLVSVDKLLNLRLGGVDVQGTDGGSKL